MEEDSPQGIWDHIAEKMLLEVAECTCPIFRATTPLSRGKLRSKGHGKLSIHYCADQATIETIFRIMFLQISSVSTEQSQTCVKNVNPFTIGQSNLIKWWDNQLCSVKSRQKFLWRMMTPSISKLSRRTILCKGLSWIHSSKRWWIITTKRMDPGKHKNWTRAGRYDQLLVQ